MWKRVILLVLIFVLLLSAVPVLAEDSVDIGVTAQGIVSGGITSFTITYTSDTQLDLSWSLYGDVSKIMIRSKYGTYPENIPDKYTEPSDGVLVYYGSGNSTSDTSMDFNQNPGGLYYVAWAQRADGTWYTDINKGWKESKEMILIAILALALSLTYFTWRTRNPLFAISGFAAWMFVMVYTRSNPIGDTVVGSTADTFLMFIFLVMGLGTVGLWIRSRSGAREMPESGGYEGGGGYVPREGHGGEAPIVSFAKRNYMDLNETEYRALARKALHPNPRRRR